MFAGRAIGKGGEMNFDLPDGFTWDSQLQLGSPEVYRLSEEAWPRFLLDESDIPDPILKFQISTVDFEKRFRAYGIRESSTGKLIAFIQAVLVAIDRSVQELPALGWRFSIQNASVNSLKNCVSLTEACVDRKYRGRGFAKALIQGAKIEARALGFDMVIAPVRPTGKTAYPLESMEMYCRRQLPDGRIFDPWLRTHHEAGAQIMNICEDSVLVRANLTKWREWTKLQLNENGLCVIEGGLVPLDVRLPVRLPNRLTGEFPGEFPGQFPGQFPGELPDQNSSQFAEPIAVYREPNVWMKYTL